MANNTSHPMHLVLVTSQARRPVHLQGESIARGGEGTIYRLAGDPPLVAKLYHRPDLQRRAKVEAMLADPPELPVLERRGRRYVQLTWPVGLLEDARGNFFGYAMPLVDLRRATLLDNLLSAKARRAYDLPEHYRYRVTAAYNLAHLIAELHAHGHHVIDLKPGNINVYSDQGAVALLDTDGFSIRGDAERFPAQVFTDGYIAPEALRQGLTADRLGEEQDRFALAVILFQLLNQGLHPYQGVPRPGAQVPPSNGERIRAGLYAYGRRSNALLLPSPWSTHRFFAASTRALFDQAFEHERHRPSAAEWTEHLRTLLQPGGLRQCERVADHAYFTDTCGLCALQDGTQDAQTPPPSVSAASVGAASTTSGSAANVQPASANRRSTPWRWVAGGMAAAVLAVAVALPWYWGASPESALFKAIGRDDATRAVQLTEEHAFNLSADYWRIEYEDLLEHALASNSEQTLRALIPHWQDRIADDPGYWLERALRANSARNFGLVYQAAATPVLDEQLRGLLRARVFDHADLELRNVLRESAAGEREWGAVREVARQESLREGTRPALVRFLQGAYQEAGAIATPEGLAVANDEWRILAALAEDGADLAAPSAGPYAEQPVALADLAVRNAAASALAVLVQYDQRLPQPQAAYSPELLQAGLCLALFQGWTRPVEHFLSHQVPFPIACHEPATDRSVDALDLALEKAPATAVQLIGKGYPFDDLHFLDALVNAPVAVVDAYLAQGAALDRLYEFDSADVPGHGRQTPLTLAAQLGRDDLVELFLSRGAAVDEPAAHGFTALMHAAMRPGNARVARLLLDAGSDPQRRNANGDNPLLVAARHGAEDVAEVLPNPSPEDRARALRYWAGSGSVGQVEALLQSDRMPQDALDQALLRALGADELSDRHLKTARLLLERDARIVGDASVYHRLIGAPFPDEEIEALVELFGRHGGLDGQYDGDTPLSRAVTLGRCGLIPALVAAGAPINQPDAEGRSALMVQMQQPALGRSAPQSSFSDCVGTLLSAGADPNFESSSGDTPLSLLGVGFGQEPNSTRSGPAGAPLLREHRQALGLLVRAGGDLNRRNRHGQSPFVHAARHGNNEFVRLGLEIGGDPCDITEEIVRLGGDEFFYSDWNGEISAFFQSNMFGCSLPPRE
ncbi:ankyrin repeat domain-containing protein [Alkalilimnicola ehrlichii]|nr:ankyrin repeat domain-containing protein [Alkalilimnicola ehrlichii]